MITKMGPGFIWSLYGDMEASWNGGTPQIIYIQGILHSKPSMGTPMAWTWILPEESMDWSKEEYH